MVPDNNKNYARTFQRELLLAIEWFNKKCKRKWKIYLHPLGFQLFIQHMFWISEHISRYLVGCPTTKCLWELQTLLAIWNQPKTAAYVREAHIVSRSRVHLIVVAETTRSPEREHYTRAKLTSICMCLNRQDLPQNNSRPVVWRCTNKYRLLGA